MKTVCIIQARMGSTRLPGKVLLPLLNETVLQWTVTRVQRARLVDQVVIATTTEPGDDAIVDHCTSQGWNFFRGSQDDVLDRYYQAASAYGADHVVRITSDCPLIDPQVVDFVIAAYFGAAPQVDYASATLERTFPRGLDTEVFSFAALERAWKEDASSQTREHVTPYLYQHPEQFRLYSVVNPVNYSHHRWTLDTAADYELLRRIAEHFGRSDFGWRDVLAAFDDHQDWFDINRGVEQKKI